MARILTSCETCGEIALTTNDVRIRFCGDDKTGCYVFACPTCSAHVAKPADARTLDLLVAAGCRLTVWWWPAELAEPHAGPALEWNDCIDFHDLLADATWRGWRERLTAERNRP